MWSNLFSSLVITLREGIEGALAVAIVLLYLRKTGRSSLSAAVWWGLVVAILCSILGAVLLERVPVNGEIFEGTLMFIAAIFVGSMIVWMWRASKGLKKEIEEKIDEIAGNQQTPTRGVWVALFLFTFLMIFREGIETVIFLSAVNLTTNALFSFLGGVLGLIFAVLFGVFFVRGSIKIDLGRFFKITGIVLLLFVIQLLIGGVHELAEGGLIDIGPSEMAIVGPFVKNNALFLVGVLLIPFLMLLIPSRKQELVATGSSAERRLAMYQQRKQKTWRMSAAVLSLFIVLFIAYDFVYGQNKQRISEPVPVSAENGEVRIPVSDVSDGNLHRFILAGTKIRFIMMKMDDGSIATAFDACEICGSKGYIQGSGTIVCLNCAADINKSTIGKGGGCNPIPLISRTEGGSIFIKIGDIHSQQKRF